MSQLPEDRPQWIVQPDNCICARPDQITDDVVIPRDGPTLRTDRRFHALTEDIVRRFGPVWFPMQGIQVNEIKI